ncbi:ATP-binding protein [Candidatus Woesearchaeota archaeon]|nr:ATP-binding protein [Candidatus Woesearchaeota archaeon]
MILGKITGKVTTNEFNFKADDEVKKFDYIQVLHKVYDYVLCQIVEIEKTDMGVDAKCRVIGYKDENNQIKPLRIPFEVGTEVLLAEDKFITDVIKLENPENGAYIGKLEGKDIDVKVDLSTLLTKHVAVLAKSGAGKSYTVGVLLEEIMDKKVPLLIIDPHGEYSELKQANNEEKEKLKEYKLEPRGFSNIKEYGDTKLNQNLRPLKLSDNLSTTEVMHLLPGKPTGTQQGILYNTIKSLDKINFTNILLALEGEENNAKWMIVNNLEHLNKLELFLPSFTSYNELVSGGNCSIINLKGISPDVQEIIVYKLLKDLFELRKKNKVPPFFTVIEEAHNYCPERSFGETKCSKILRTIASEGRKFGLGLCIVSQRPARVDKSVLSQCTTQIILKVTNPNDLKAISNSVEGITAESEKEIVNLSVGSTILAGITDMPLFVSVRPRMTKHGGHAVDIIEKQEDFLKKSEEFESDEMLSVVKPKTTINDLKIMSEDEIEDVRTILVPAYMFSCKEKQENFNILFDAVNGKIVVDVEQFETKKLPRLDKLSNDEIKILKLAYSKKVFTQEDVARETAILDPEKILSDLEKKHFLLKNNQTCTLSDKYIFSQMSKNACFYKTGFEKINFSHKLEKKVSIDKAKELLSKFTRVNDFQECFVVKYEVVR